MPSQFEDYFNDRINQEIEANARIGVATKYDEIQKAATEKIADLEIQHKAALKTRELQANSWVGKLGLDPDGLAGEALNKTASFISGASTQLGNLASLPSSLLSAADEASLTEEEINAYNRKMQGIATPEDMALLTRKKAFYAERDTPEAKARAQALANANPDGLTALDLIERSKKMRNVSNAITDATNISGIVHSKQRDRLTSQMGWDFQKTWDQTGLANLFEKDKHIGEAKDVAEGLAKLVYNAGEAAVSNPSAATEYIVENLPQLLGGGLLKHGTKLLTAANAGYALDNYNKGMAKYAAENDGALPSAEERQKMALYAASTAVAEQLGELGQLRAIGKVAKAGETAADGAKTGVLQSIKNVGKAGITGYGEEAATEGYQTFAEGEAQRTPATAKDVYIGAGIGGLAGGGTSAGGRAIVEALGITPEKIQAREVEADKTKLVQEAVASGNVDGLLDPKSTAYSPQAAVAALYGYSQKEGLSEKEKNSALQKAAGIVTQLEEEKTKLDEKAKTNADQTAHAEMVLEAAKRSGDKELEKLALEQLDDLKNGTDSTSAVETQLARIERHLKDAKEAFDNFNQDTQHKLVNVDHALTQISGRDHAASQAAADSIINLSMAIPERLDPNVAATLATDESNGLTDTQREYFRKFADARLADHLLKTDEDVASEIATGGKNYVGLNQYRQNISAALTAGNHEAAQEQLAQLQNFVADHKAKAAVAIKALKQYSETGNPVQIRSDGKKGWFVHEGTPLSSADLRAEGGLEIGERSNKLVLGIKGEAVALNKAAEELAAAVKHKTQPAKEVSNVKNASPAAGNPSTEKRSTQEAQTEEAVGQRDVGSAGRAAESTVQSNNSATAEEASQASGVKLQSTEKTTTAEGVSPVQAFQQKSPEGTSFAERNLIGDFFTQSAGSEDADSQRPLAKVKDFLTQTVVPLTEFLKDKTLSGQQQQAIDLLRTKAMAWNKTIVGNLVRTNPKFWYTDLMQFLIVEQGGKLNLDQNVKTAMVYAAFDHVMDQGTRTPFNTDEEINAILGRDESHPVSQQERNALGLAGTRQNVVVSSLGKTAIQALGIKAKKDAPADLMAELENTLGAHILKMMLDQGILVRNIVPGAQMAALMGSSTTNTDADFAFVKLARKDDELNPQANEIVEALLGTKNVLDKLFGSEPALKEPSLEPIPFTQSKTKGTNQKVPTKLAKIIEHENKVPSFVRQDMWQIATLVGKELLYTIAGVKDVDPSAVHVVNRAGAEAKNDGLKREVDRFLGFVSNMADITAGMYFDHTVWKQQRVGIATNVINPQTSKVHRFMLYRAAWDTEVKFDDTKQMDNFKLRVLEGFGVKTDKQTNKESLAGYDAVVNDPVIQDAVEVLRASLYEGGITEEGKNKIAAAVAKGGEKFHTLDALVALAHESAAKKEGKASFKVQMMGEIDGVTNGPMLSHLMLGAAKTVKDLFGLLNRGGFFQKGSNEKNYNVFRSKPGAKDLYEITALHMVEAVQGMLTADPKLAPALGAIWAFTGDLTQETKDILKARRNLVKTPLTAMVFGSSVKSAVDSMADGFVDSIYEAIEDAAGKGDVKKVLSDINTLLILGKGPSLKAMTTEQLMNHEFNDAQVRALKQVFKDTVGKAVQSTMEKDFGSFMDKRKALNNAANLSFELYNAVYTGLRNDFIAELSAKGEVAVDGKGNPIHDLTNQQEAELRKRVAKMMPTMHTLLSKQSDQLPAGLYGAKTKRKLSSNRMFQSQIKFGSKFKDNGASSLRVNAMESMEEAPGVAMVIMGVHSTDSAISHTALDGNEVLNVHDAHGAGLGIFEQTARNLNKATFDAMLEYSLPTEILNMLTRTVQGLAGVLQQENLPAAVKQNLATVLSDFARQNELSVDQVLNAVLSNAQTVAFEANKIRLDALTTMESVDQYALEGGNYEVTDADRAAAAEKRAALQPVTMHPADIEALTTIVNVLGDLVKMPDPDVKPEPKPVTATVFGELGRPEIKSEGDLVAFFKANPNATAKQVIDLLSAPGRLSPINRKLLQLASRIVSPDMSIKFITSKSAEDTVLEMPGTASRGWFVVKGNQSEIYVLSPEFKNSGLTSETLLHELVHAALAKTIAKPTAETQALVNELEALRQKAQEFVNANQLTGFGPALKDVQEFVAWGMTNLEFQRDVLNKITFESKTKGNALVTGLQKLISNLTQLLYKRADENVEKGLTVLVSNVSGLFAAAAQNLGAEQDIGLNLSQETVNQTNEDIDAIEQYSTLEIFNALDNGSLQPDFKYRLANLLGDVVRRLYGPFGAFAAQMRKTEAGNPLAVWLKAIETGHAPFASAIVASGFAGSAQEDFAMQQIEATVKAALDGNESITSMAYRELSHLYNEAREQLKPSDFDSQEDYDFVFKIEANNGDKSDYLARFAALGLGNQKMNKLLGFDTKRDMRTFGEGKTFLDRLQNVLEKIVNFFAERITHTYGGQRADHKLEALVSNLVDIEARKRYALAVKANSTNYFAPVEDAVKDAMDKARAGIAKAAGSKLVRENKNAFVRAAGGLARNYANDQVEWFLEGLQRLRDKEFKGRQGVVASLINEIKGPKDVMSALLRETKHREQTRKNIITQSAAAAMKMFSEGGENLTKETKASVTRVFLRTGLHHLVGTYTMAQIENLLDNKTALNQEIAAVEARLAGPAQGHYIEQANGLGYFKATGRVRTAVLMLNAHLIARLSGTPYAHLISEQQAQQAEGDIATLATLYALKYTNQESQALAKEVMRTENARTDGNGIEYVLAMHKKLENESRDRLFKENPALMIHGYTPEILNPHTAVKIANDEDGKDLINQGYSHGFELIHDDADPDRTPKRLYVLRDGGLAPWLSGIMSLSSLRSKGTKAHNGYLNVKTLEGLENSQIQSDITSKKMTAMKAKVDPRRDLTKQSGNLMVPVYNEAGKIVNWRYMMSESIKDTLLERNNDFDQILGTLAGSIYDKETAREQNKKALEALRDQYRAEYATHADSYVRVGPNSDDPALRDIWALLPEDTRTQARDIFGKDGIMVRSDTLDIMFGYRKYSLAEMFHKNPEARNQLENLFVGLMESVLANYAGYKHGLSPDDARKWAQRAAVIVTRGERAWQELVREAKDIIVVKTGLVLLGNVWSNLSLLSMSGVPMKNILRDHLVAIKGAMAYQEDSKKLYELEQMLSLGYQYADRAEVEREIARLKDAIARNPVKELIDAGLMPTIVEDVAAEDDPYSYKTELTRRTEGFMNKLNPGVKAVGRFVYMTHDTPMYQWLSQSTQLSDFVARYTLYQHLISREKGPLSKAQAIQDASDAFVNYDIPMHKAIQYGDDMGVIMFTKYFLRIQRVLLKLTRENPARVFLTLALNRFMDLGPIVLDSSMVHHIGFNPIHSGAFELPGALDELATVQAGMSLIK